MRVQRLLQERTELLLSPKGRQELKLLLAPLLCRNESEQNQFYEIYEEYLEKDLQISQAEKAEQQAQIELEKAQIEPESWWEKWLPLLAGILFGLGALGTFIYSLQNPPKLFIAFEKLQKEAKVGDTLRIKNLSDTTDVVFKWHCFDMETNHSHHDHEDRHLEWFIEDADVVNHKKQIKLHAHHPETNEHLGTDSMEITILCNTLHVGSISVADTIFRPNRPLPFSVEVGESENLSYEWQFQGNDTIFAEVAPVYTFPQSGNFWVKVTVKDTVNTIGLCSKTVQTNIKIDPEKPDDAIALATFDLLEEPPKIENPLQPWYLPLLLLLMSAAGWCWWKWLKRPDPNQLAAKASNLALKNRFASPDKKPYSIPFAPAEGKIQADRSQFDIANSLRNRQQGTRKIMDVPATLTATVEQGGFPSLQYRYTSKPTDYLVLIDWQSADSHLARLFHYLATMLQEQDVLLDIFYYQNDFERVWNERHPKGIHLEQLHRLYPQQRLLIFGNAHALVSQANDEQLLQPVWERQLRKWTVRLLLTSVPIVSWTYIEARLYRLFALFPADLSGIIQAVRFLESGAAEEDLPTTLREWENQLQKSQIEEDIQRKWRTLPHHEQYLEDHPEVLRWLKALVVYPQPTWNVTIAIGKALGVPVTYNNLMLLARIPWLQDGDFKTRLWRSIWPEFSITDEKIARQAVKEELETVRRQTANAFAGQQLEQELAVQNFALEPSNAEHQEIIQFLKTAGLLPNIHVEELDKVVKRHIPKHRTGKEVGQTLVHYLEDAQQERAEKIKRPVGTTHFWWGLALSLLSLLGAAGLLVKGENPHRQHIETHISEAARLNNEAVNFMASTQSMTVNYKLPDSIAKTLKLEDLGIINNASIEGFSYKSTSALQLWQIALLYDSTLIKAHHNFQKQLYNDGISHYNEYVKDKSYDLQTAIPFLKKAIEYQGITSDSISHAAMYALANVHHILGEEDSVCVLLDSLLKVADVPFFDSIPNLDTEAIYCKKSELLAEQSNLLRGLVVDNITKKPLYRVLITDRAIRTRTDQSGNFEIDLKTINNRTSSLNLRFSDPNYQTLRTKVDLSNQQEMLDTVFLMPKGIPERTDSSQNIPQQTPPQQTIEKKIVVSGKVIENISNKPIPGVKVGTSVSDNEGNYSYSFVPNADYNGVITFDIKQDGYIHYQQSTNPNTGDVQHDIKLDPDFDGDGIKDMDDYCPASLGLRANNGCPQMILGEQFKWLDGNWFANVVQTDSKTKWDVAFKADFAKQIFISDYDDFPCTAVWNPIRIKENTLCFREKIIRDNESERKCADWNYLEVENINKEEIKVTYFLADGTTKVAEAILKKVYIATALSTGNIPIPETVLVQGGTFTMGCTKEQEPNCDYNEKPAHEVQVPTFRMGKYEVTNEQFAAFLNEKGNQEEGGAKWVDLEGDYNGMVCGVEEIKGQFQAKKGLEKHPMIYVSWYGAKAYAQWLSEKTEQNWRLPSEAEWEYAARGGQKGKVNNFIYAGSDDIEDVAWYRENSYDKGKKHPDYGTHPVGQKKANELGIYDMSGNVWEWTEDCWHDDYKNAPKNGEPWLENDQNDCPYCVIRGGSWYDSPQDCRVAYRFNARPSDRRSRLGFRLVLSSQFKK